MDSKAKRIHICVQNLSLKTTDQSQIRIQPKTCIYLCCTGLYLISTHKNPDLNQQVIPYMVTYYDVKPGTGFVLDHRANVKSIQIGKARVGLFLCWILCCLQGGNLDLDFDPDLDKNQWRFAA